jgi:hypothetical protein
VSRQREIIGYAADAATTGVPHVTWTTLGQRARAWRVVHAAWAVAQLACLGYIWTCAVTGRRDRRLGASVAFLLVEGGALVVGRGDCPVGPRQAAWGDPVPFFELVLPPREAKAAVPVLAIVSVAGMVALVMRRPRQSVSAITSTAAGSARSAPHRNEIRRTRA